jgi:cell division protein FtsB
MRWAWRVALALALAGSLAYVPYRLLDPVATRQVAELGDELFRTRAQSDELAAANASIRREINALRDDPGTIAAIARDDLGMVRADEIIIRVEATRPRPLGAAL